MRSSLFRYILAESIRLCSVQDLRTGGSILDAVNFVPRMYTSSRPSLYNGINSSLADEHCFEDGYMGKQPVAWKK